MKAPSAIALVTMLVAAAVGAAALLLASSTGVAVDADLMRAPRRYLQSRTYCACAGCTTEVWNTPADPSGSGPTCGAVLLDLRHQMSNLDSCRRVAAEYPATCGVCDPDTCGSSSAGTTSASSPSSSGGPGTLAIVGDNGSPAAAFALGECEGDCDSDGDCDGGLVCFQRSGSETVPGCSGSAEDGRDYCVRAGYGTSAAASSSSNLPQLALKGGDNLGQCEGDCNSNADCQTGLFCYQRNAGESVPGCSGNDATDADYCIDPYELHSIPPQNMDDHGRSGSVFALKLHWEPGYRWQGETFERKWCMRCDSTSKDCSAGHRVYLTNCDIDTIVTEWEFQYASGGDFQVKVATSNLCLTVPDNTQDPLYVDTCDSGNDHQFYTAQNGQAAWGSAFELHPVWASDGCVGDTHHPKYGETLYVWRCEVSRAWTTADWNFY